MKKVGSFHTMPIFLCIIFGIIDLVMKMKFKHEYTIQMMIEKPIDQVTSFYINRKTMPLWEKGLTEISDIKNKLFEQDSEGFLLFSINGYQMSMKTSVISNHLPSEITMVYEVPGAWNQCINRFEAIQNQTKWTMDVIFEMEHETYIEKDRFIAKTTEAMRIYKDFIEHYEQN